MEDIDPSIYTGFKGAGAPGAPPPQKPNTNPIKFVYGVILAGIVLLIVCLVISSFASKGTEYFQLFISALCAGIATVVVEWMYEIDALATGRWFNYCDGHSRLGKINLHLPIEIMTIFIFLAPCLVYASYVPELSRRFGINIWPFSDPFFDLPYIVVMLLMVSLIAAFSDFTTHKKVGLWMNGPDLTYWKMALTCWLPGATITVVVGRILMLVHPASLLTAVLILFLILTASIALFSVTYMRKHRDILEKS